MQNIKITDEIAKSFWSKVEKTDSCWIWKGTIFKFGGYARFPNGYNSTTNAHRIAWQLCKGEIPQGMMILHTCDNRICVNPDHLYLGTHQDNMRDRQQRNRQGRGYAIGKGGIKRRGENNGRAKLTKEQVQEIRDLHKQGKYSQEYIGSLYGVGQCQVWRILNNWQWNT